MKYPIKLKKYPDEGRKPLDRLCGSKKSGSCRLEAITRGHLRTHALTTAQRSVQSRD